MSKTIDEKVVEMRFDNKQFESGVRTSMSTLDKLKRALKLDDAAKGLDNISKSAKNFDVSGMSNGLDSVTAKFSALDVIGVTALANITNSAINAGKNLIKALTIEPVTTGFNEYELKMNSIQTIMMSTGESVEVVNGYLNELNKYSDETIYSFQDMTSNIGKFTNAGVKLEDAVAAIKGVSNEAAVSGANANEASHAMYNFAQALSAGYVKLIDWKSIENANMATVEFKQQLIDTAVEMGTLTEAADGMYDTGKNLISSTQNFNDSLQDQWMTSEVLIETLKKYSDKETDIGKKAYEAATKVKTFSQMLDVLKETAQSGWAQTWELIFGDIEQAKSIFTPLTNFFGSFIDSISDFRNGILENALTSPFTNILDKISAVKETTDETVETFEDLGRVVDNVVNGDFSNGEERINKLTDAGYNLAKVQNKVNEELEDSTRHEEGISEAVEKQTKQIGELTDAKLKEIGLTDEEIKQYHQLKKAADEAGMSVEDYVKSIERVDGRTLLVESFQNIGNAIKEFGKAVKGAWNDIFPDTQSKLGESLYNLIDGFHNLTSGLADFDDEASKIKRTFKGVFALLDIVSTLIGGPLKIGLKIICKMLGMVDVDVLSVTATIGDMIVAFRDWLFENNRLVKGAKKVVLIISDFVKAFLEIPKIKEAIDSLKEINLTELGKNIIQGLQNGIKDGIGKIPEGILEICQKIYDTVVEFFDINSPSRTMYDLGVYIIEGLFNGIKSGIDKIGDIAKIICEKFKETFDGFNWNSLFAGGISISLILIIKKLADAINTLTGPIGGLGDLLSGVGKVLNESAKPIAKIIKSSSKVVKAFANDLNAVAFKIRAKALINIAKAVAILVGSIAALTFLDQDKLWEAVKIVGVLSLVLVGLAAATHLMSKSSTKIDKDGVSINNAIPAILGISAALFIVAKAVKMMGTMKPEEFDQGLSGLVGAMMSIGILAAIFGAFSKGPWASSFDVFASTISKISASIIILAVACKLIGKLSEDEIEKGKSFALAFLAFISILRLISIIPGKSMDNLGKTTLKLTIAMGLMVGVCKLASKLSDPELKQSSKFALGFLAFITILQTISMIPGNRFNKLGLTLMGISTAMLIMVGVVKLLAMIEPEELKKGIKGLWKFVGVITVLTLITKLGGNAKVAGTLLAMSASIAILAGAAIVLSLIDPEGLKNGVKAIGALSICMGLMIAATKNAKNCKGNLIVMTVAIGVMAAAVAALSMIDDTKLAGATSAMSVLMGMFALMTSVAGKAKGAMGSLIVMTLVVGMIGALVYVLADLPVESTLGAAGALSMLLLSLSASCAILSLSNGTTISALGAAAVMTLIVGALTFIIYKLASTNVGPTLEIAKSLSILLLSLSAACGILTLVGLGGPAALIGIGVLEALIVGIGSLVIGIGVLMDKVPKLQEFLDTGIPVLNQIGNALGSFFGNIVGGFLEGATSGLPRIGTNLSDFVTNAQQFFDGCKNIDESVMNGVKALAETILILTGIDLANTITSWITGGSSMTDFANQLIPFGKAVVAFSKEVSGNIDEESVVAAANAGKLLAEMSKTLPNTGGVAGFFAGENDLGSWSPQLITFGKAIVAFSKEVSGNVDSEAVESAANAGRIMADMAKTLPNTGGVAGFFAGDNDMGYFATQLVSFGKAIVSFSNEVGGKVDGEAVEAAANAGRMMSSMASSIPNSGGLVSFFTGDNNMILFGIQLRCFGKSIKKYSEEVSGIDVEAITASAQAAIGLAILARAIPNGGGIFQVFSGKNDIDDFGNKLKSFGKSIKKYSKEVSGIDTGSIVNSANGLKSIIGLAKNASGVDFGGINSLAKSLNKISKKSVDDFVKGFKDSSAKITEAGKSLMESAIKGVNAGKPGLMSAVSKAADGIKNSYSSFNTAGKHLGNGLIEGIKSKETEVYNAAYALGRKAVQGEKDGQKSNSPSKLTIQAGKWLGEGLIIGIDSMGRKVYNASSEIGDTAAKSMTNAVSKIRDSIEGNVDSQPTIRPVLDLSDIKSGASNISEMLNMGKSIGIMGNVTAINSMMNRRNQNGVNDDVVSAINDLKNTISASSGNSYRIDNITYDDGSNVADAIESLIRAATIERRV